MKRRELNRYEELDEEDFGPSYYKNRNGGYYNRYYNDGYYGSYYSNKRTNSWSNSWTYNWFKEEKNDDQEDMVKTPENYRVPSSNEFNIYLRGNDSKQLIQDLSRFFFYKMVNNPNYIADKYLDESKLSQEDVDKLNKYKEMLSKLWDIPIPGFTPKEKAEYVFHQLHYRDEADPISKILELDDKSINRLRLSNDDYFDPILNELYDKLKQDAVQLNKIAVLKNISMIKEFGKNFKIEKQVESKIVENSKIHNTVLMREYSQVLNAEIYQRCLPNFNQKFLTKDLLIRSPIDKTSHMQKLIILLDFSGSMCTVEKQQWVTAILIERLKYAILEECEIFFSYYCRELVGTMHRIHNRDSALEFWRKFSTRPNGGDTNIGGVVKEINDYVKTSDFFNTGRDLSEEKPEILVICDGQDDPKMESYPYKTNIISLVSYNKKMENFAVKSGGTYIHIDMDGSYSKVDKEDNT